MPAKKSPSPHGQDITPSAAHNGTNHSDAVIFLDELSAPASEVDHQEMLRTAGSSKAAQQNNKRASGAVSSSQRPPPQQLSTSSHNINNNNQGPSSFPPGANLSVASSPAFIRKNSYSIMNSSVDSAAAPTPTHKAVSVSFSAANNNNVHNHSISNMNNTNSPTIAARVNPQGSSTRSPKSVGGAAAGGGYFFKTNSFAKNNSSSQQPPRAVTENNSSRSGTNPAERLQRGGRLGSNTKDNNRNVLQNTTKRPKLTPAEEAALTRRGKFTIPLYLILGFVVAVVLAAFIVVIVFSSVKLDEAARDQVKNSVQASLSHAQTAIESALRNYEGMLLDIRERYLTSFVVSGGIDPCADNGGHALLGDSSGVLSDFYSSLSSHPTLDSLYSVRRSVRFPNVTSVGSSSDRDNYFLTQCGVMLDRLWILTNDTNRFSDRAPTMFEFANLDVSLPSRSLPDDYPLVETLVNEANVALRFIDFKWTVVIGSAYGNGSTTSGGSDDVHLVGIAPTWLNITNTSSGETNLLLAETFAQRLEASEAVRGNQTNPNRETDADAILFPAYLSASSSLEVFSVSSVVATISLSSYRPIMRQVSVQTAGSHTSLYDVTPLAEAIRRHIVSSSDQYVPYLVTTSLTESDPRLYVNMAEGSLWRAGQTPSEAANDAYFTADIPQLLVQSHAELFDGDGDNDHENEHHHNGLASSSNIQVVIDDWSKSKDSIVAAIVIPPTAFGLQMAIVLSVPRKHYYGDINHVRAVTIGIGVAAIFTVIVVSVVTGVLAFLSLRKIRQNMSLAASLKTEKVTFFSSRLYEIQQLNIAFEHLNEKLIVAKAFLPQHMLAQAVSSSDDDDDESDIDLDGKSASNSSYDDESSSAALQRKNRKNNNNKKGNNFRGARIVSRGGGKSPLGQAASCSKYALERGDDDDDEDDTEGDVTLFSARDNDNEDGDDDEGSADVNSTSHRSKSRQRSVSLAKANTNNNAGLDEAKTDGGGGGGGGGGEEFMYEGIVLNAKPDADNGRIGGGRIGKNTSFDDLDEDGGGDDDAGGMNPNAALVVGPDGLPTMTNKRVTILAINARQFYKRMNFSNPSSVVFPAETLTEIMALVAKSHRGVIDSFHGDHFVLSFNAAKHNAEGPLKACRAAMEILAIFEGEMDFSMGLSSGRACVGHLGSSTLKRLSIIGPVYSKAMALESLCRRYGNSARASSTLLLNTNNNNKTTTAQDSSGAAVTGGGAAERDASNAKNSAKEDTRSTAVQCFSDGVFVAEVQHMCIVQVVCGAPPTMNSTLKPVFLHGNGASAGHDTSSLPLPPAKIIYCIRSMNNKYKTKILSKSAALKYKEEREQEEAAGNNGNEEDDDVEGVVIGTPPKQQSLDKKRKKRQQDEADEWLYEINSGSDISIIPQINTALLNYLASATTALNFHINSGSNNNDNAMPPKTGRRRRSSSSHPAGGNDPTHNMMGSNNGNIATLNSSSSASQQMIDEAKRNLREAIEEIKGEALGRLGVPSEPPQAAQQHRQSQSADHQNKHQSLPTFSPSTSAQLVNSDVPALIGPASVAALRQLATVDFYGALAAEHAMRMANVGDEREGDLRGLRLPAGFLSNC